MSEAKQRQYNLLNDSIPESNLSYKSKGGTSLSYVPAEYIIRRLNLIFGNDGWTTGVIELSAINEELGQSKAGKPQWKVSYRAKVKLTVSFQAEDVFTGQYLHKEDYGCGHGYGADKGEAHESALKEAVTDALKRCARYLGDSVGLALYGQNQNVGELEFTDKGFSIADTKKFALVGIESATNKEEYDLALAAARELVSKADLPAPARKAIKAAAEAKAKELGL